MDSVASDATNYGGYGVSIGGYNQHYSGSADEVNTWDRALSNSEVFSIYQSGLTGNESGLTALWHFDEGGGITAMDASPNGYHATLYNGVSFGPLTGLTATGEDQKITLQWNPVTEVNVLRYRIFRDTLPDPTVQIDSTTGTSRAYTGLINFKKYYFRVAIVDQSGNQVGFASVTGTPTIFQNVALTMPDLEDKSVSWGDYDDDGDYDLLVVGGTSWDPGVATIYKNTGGTFSEQSLGFDASAWAVAASWCDYNNDGLLDVSYTGATGNGGRTFKIYKNNGNGTFTDIPNNIRGVAKGWISWVDLDNDGDQDVAVMGEASYGGGESGYTNTALYQNNGNGTFSEIDAGLTGLSRGSMAWSDYDKDGDMDVLMVGTTDRGYNGRSVFLYRNDGNNRTSWTDVTASAFNTESPTGVVAGACAFGDLNNDGYPDIVYTGGTGGSRAFKVYLNNGDGTFTDQEVSLTGVTKGLTSLGDFDNDGDLDILVSGENTTGSENGWGNFITYIAVNNGSGQFTMLNPGTEQIGSEYRTNVSGGWNDFDRDGRLDILLAGMNSNEENLIKLYRNGSGGAANAAPSDPPFANMTTTTSLDTVRFSWGKSNDNGRTPDNGLTYNLRVGSVSAGVNIMSPLAKVTGAALGGGFRYVFENGNAGNNTSWRLQGLPDGTYFWSVEAIDQMYRNSKFQQEKSFTIDGAPDKIKGVTVSAGVGSATLKWLRDRKSDIKRYEIYDVSGEIGDSVGAATGGLLDTSITITGLNNGQLYYFVVRGVDNAGHVGEFSDYVSVLPSTTPGKWFVTSVWDDYESSGTLREAIDGANTASQSDTIVFLIPKGSVISLWNSLPTITTDFTIIDGDSDKDGNPDIILDGSNEGYGNIDGFTVASSNNLIKGLVFQGFADMSTAGGNKEVSKDDAKAVSRDRAKSRSNETRSLSKSDIAQKRGKASQRTSKGPMSLSNPKSEANESKANLRDSGGGKDFYGYAAIVLNGPNAQNNMIVGNYIGTDLTGNDYAYYGNQYGILVLDGASGNKIGNGTPAGRNIISGNYTNAIHIYGSYNVCNNNSILGNHIGVNKNGDEAVWNGGHGIAIQDKVSHTMIGNGTAGGRNIISGNSYDGVYLYGYSASTDNNFILGNYIGIASDGATQIGNGWDGIYFEKKASNNQVGDGTPGGRNIISGNGYGIYFYDYNGHLSGNKILGNYIGTDASGMNGVGNYYSGIYLDAQSGGNSIINTQIGDGTVGGMNVISGNGTSEGGSGIEIYGYNAHNNSVNRNYIGLNKDGDVALGNYGNGVSIYNSSDNTILNNVISGNEGIGIRVSTGYSYSYANDNVIEGNKIGTDVSGTSAIGNNGDGIHLAASSYNATTNNTVIKNNVISGNQGSGISLGEGQYYDGVVENTSILGNFIGTNAAGTAAIPNQSHGVYIYNYNDRYTLIGDGTPAGRNIISGNTQSGIWLEYTSYNTVLGNFIGVDVTGNIALPNDSCGIALWNSSSNRIGDGTIGGLNVVSANGKTGIEIYAGYSNSANYNFIGGNHIGVGLNVTTALGNGEHGVEIEARDEGDYAYQDTVYANVIAFNGESGIKIESNPYGGAYDNPLLGNRIYSNGGDGIELEGGANYGIQPPVITAISNFTVSGTSAPYAKVEVHKGPDDEGQFIIGQTTADENGLWSLLHNAAPGVNITALQDSTDNTSAFSAAMVTPSGNLTSSTATVNFATAVFIGDSAMAQVRLWASGNPVIVNNALVATPHYSIAGSVVPDTLFNVDTLTYTVKFKPTVAGSLSDTIKLNNSSTVNPKKIILTGTGKVNTAPNAFNVKALASSLINTRRPTITWEGRGDVDGDSVKYTLAISKNANMSSPQFTQANIVDTSFTVTSDLDQVALYYYRVTGQDPRGGVTQSNTGFFRVDAQAPTAAVGALTLNVVPVKKYLQVYIATSEKLKTDTVRFVLNSVTDNSHTLTALANNVYTTDYELTATGSLAIRVTGLDSANNYMNQTQNYTIITVSKDQPLAFNEDGIELTGIKGSFTEEGYMLIGRTMAEAAGSPSATLNRAKVHGAESLAKDEVSAVASSNAEWTQVGAGVDIISTATLVKTLALKVTYAEEELALARVRYPDFDERKVGIYRENDGQWIYEGGEGKEYTVNAKIKSTGSLAVFYNPSHEFIPTRIELVQNYPNPFNPSTTIKFGLPDESRVKLVIYNVLGQKVKELLNDTRGAGYHTVMWNGRNETGQQVSSGLYIYRLETAKGVQSKKMLLIK